MEGLRFILILGTRVSVPEGLEGLAATALAQGHIERSIRLSGAAEVLREAIGSSISPAVQSIRADCLARVCRQVDESTFTQDWESGRAMSLAQAIEFALETV